MYISLRGPSPPQRPKLSNSWRPHVDVEGVDDGKLAGIALERDPGVRRAAVHDPNALDQVVFAAANEHGVPGEIAERNAETGSAPSASLR